MAEIVQRMSVEPQFYFAVVDAQGTLKGLITELDLVRLVYASGTYEAPEGVGGRIPAYLGWGPEQLRTVTAREIMTYHPEAVRPEDGVEELARIMFRNRRKVVLVVENKRLVGVVQRVDLVRRVLG